MTTPDVRWSRALDVFDAAIAIADPAERARMVAAACEGDASLGEAVRRLLEADAGDSPLLDAPAAVHAADLVEDDAGEPVSAVGRSVGPYRILRELGHGGMGVVYLAERADVSLRVALKLVRGGLAAPEHVERFLLERRVLARLEHPHIARMLDAGVAEDGTPWFAMEYVEGEPIDRFCDARRLGVAERLALFERVCEAVQFAQRNLVVHRDLKPSNVLVTDPPGGTPGMGEPKLLDFGVAKLLEDGADAATTGTVTRLMTPDYASPEQVSGRAVTTATDVYSLGVVLYELLTGRRPYSLKGASLPEVVRTVLQAEPARPSAVVARDPEVATARGTTPERLRRQLAGDLDTIVGKALEKQPERRYPSAEALLGDLRRYREGRAVSARPATLWYRARTFVRRYRVLVTAAAALVLLLAGFAASMTYQQAQTARALRLAEAEAEKARDVTGFLVGMFRDADPFQQGRGDSGGAASRGPLDLATEHIERELADQPGVRVELLGTLGVIHRNLGNLDRADQLLRAAIDDRRRVPGASDRPDRELASLLHELGATLFERSEYDSAEQSFRRALAMRRAVLPAEHPDVGATLSALGRVRRLQGQFDEADRLLGEAVAILERRAEGPELAEALEQRAVVRRTVGDVGSAEQLVRRAIAIRERVLGPDHPSVASGLTRLAWVLLAVDLDGAEQAARQALTIAQRRLGPGHPNTLYTKSQLSLVLRDKGELEAAERLQREVLAGRRRLHGEYHRDVAGSLHNLSGMLRRRGDLTEAEAMLRRSIAVYRKATGTATDLVPVILDLATLRHERGDHQGALDLAHEVVGFPSEAMVSWDARMAGSLVELASLLGKYHDCDGARALYRRASAIYADLPPNQSAIVPAEDALAACR